MLIAGTKGRGLEPYFRMFDNDEFVFCDNSVGHSQIAVAYVCSLMGKKLKLFIRSNNNVQSIQTERAIKYGAKYGVNVSLIKNKMSELINLATKYSLDHNAAFIDLTSPEYQCIMVRAFFDIIPKDLDPLRIWMTFDSGTVLRAAATVFDKTDFIALPIVKPINLDQYPIEIQERLILDHDPLTEYTLEEEATEIPPYPSSKYYDAKIWKIANCEADEGDYIWNTSN